MINIGVLGSTNGTDLQAILDAIKNKIIDATIKIVVSNRESAFILERAKNHGVDAHYISHKHKTREEFDREVTSLLEKKNVDLVLLIGFMRILSKEFCQKWQDKMAKIHNVAEVIVAKQRHGPIGKVNLHFEGSTTKFSNLSKNKSLDNIE